MFWFLCMTKIKLVEVNINFIPLANIRKAQTFYVFREHKKEILTLNGLNNYNIDKSSTT